MTSCRVRRAVRASTHSRKLSKCVGATPSVGLPGSGGQVDAWGKNVTRLHEQALTRRECPLVTLDTAALHLRRGGRGERANPLVTARGRRQRCHPGQRGRQINPGVTTQVGSGSAPERLVFPWEPSGGIDGGRGGPTRDAW